MAIFKIKTSDAEIFRAYREGQEILKIDHLIQYEDEIAIGAPVLLLFGGDGTPWINGLYAIAKVNSIPLEMGYEQAARGGQYYKLEIKIILRLERVFEKIDFIRYPESFDSGVAPSTKGERNQALGIVDDKDFPKIIASICRALLDSQPEYDTQLREIFGDEVINYSLNHSIVYGQLQNEQEETPKSQEQQSESVNRQMILFGAPGTGKSHKLNDEALIFENQTRVILEKTMDENVIKDEVDKAIVAPKGRKLTSLNAIGFKYADFWKERTHLSKQEIRSFCKYQKISEIYLGAAAKFILDVDALKMTEEELSDITYIKALLHDDKKRGENDKLKWANAIGYKMGESDDYANLSLKDIEIELDLKGAQMWWLYRGIQAARLKEDEESISEEPFVERVTFHPNYSYAQFVGTYKPVQDDEDEKQIKYEYVPGPFMRVYRNAKKNPNNNFLLIIEEINRANVAAVFGDVFQLLDRKNGISEYPVAASEDIQKYLAKYGINERKLSIPSNMYIWATMNSADQGVFPMDTAFKRRWEFEYIGIDENEDGIKDYDIPLQKKEDDSHEWVKWNDLRHSINDKLTAMKINEDKLLGPYFISEEKLKLVEGKNEENANEFVKSFKSKVLMYLFEDAVKMRPGDLFDENAIGRLRFSDICKKFDEIGQGIFNF
jgi:hypothetical protein